VWVFEKTGTPPSRAKTNISRSDFIILKTWFDRVRPNTHEIEHYYLAQIAQQIHKSNLAKPKNIPIEDYLIKFKSKEEKMPPAEERQRMNAWLFGMFGAATVRKAMNK